MTAPINEQVWYTPAQAGDAYGVPTSTVQRLIREGVIDAKNRGGGTGKNARYSISRDAMDCYMASLPDA